jgi:hypothetical protein
MTPSTAITVPRPSLAPVDERDTSTITKDSRPYRGCRITLHDSVSTPNSRPEHGRMSGSDDQIVGGMCRTSDLTKTLGKLCDSLYLTRILRDHGRAASRTEA